MKIMHKITPALAVALMGMAFASCSEAKDKAIDVTQLPASSQNFIKTYFADNEVKCIKLDKEFNKTEYEVKFVNGFEVTFDETGAWTDVDAPSKQTIPDGIAPEPIVTYVAANYAGNGINEISKNKRGYDVDLTNGTDLLFNHQGEFQGIDH